MSAVAGPTRISPPRAIATETTNALTRTDPTVPPDSAANGNERHYRCLENSNARLPTSNADQALPTAAPRQPHSPNRHRYREAACRTRQMRLPRRAPYWRHGLAEECLAKALPTVVRNVLIQVDRDTHIRVTHRITDKRRRNVLLLQLIRREEVAQAMPRSVHPVTLIYLPPGTKRLRPE